MRLKEAADRTLRLILRDNQIPELWPSLIREVSKGELSAQEVEQVEAMVRRAMGYTNSTATIGPGLSEDLDEAPGTLAASVANKRTIVRTIDEDPSLIAYKDIDRIDPPRRWKPK